MAKIYAQDVLEIAFRGTHAGKPVANVLHVANDEAGGTDESKVRDVLDNWQDHVLTCMSSQYTLTECVWRSLDPSEGDVGTMPLDGTKKTTGALTGECMPPNVAYHVRKHTEGRQRGQRDGRLFLPGVIETHADAAGVLLANIVTSQQVNLDAFVSGVNDWDPLNPGGSGLVVLNTTPESRLRGTHEVTLTWRRVSGLTIDPLLSTQRDRLR